MTRIDQNKVQQLIKELRGLAIPNYQYKYWKLEKNLTKEQLINLEKLLVKESKRTRKGDYKWSKEVKEALFTLYPWLHPCCFLRNVREALNNDNYYQLVEQAEATTWQEKLKKAKHLTKLVEKEVEEAEQLRIKEATYLLLNNPKEFFRDDRKQSKQ